MIRIFAGATRDHVVPGNALTIGTLLVHLGAVGALLIPPVRHLVTRALMDTPLVYLAPPDREAGQSRERDAPAYGAAARAPGKPLPGPAAIEPDQTDPGQGAPIPPSADEPVNQPAPRAIEEAAATELEVDSAVVRDPSSAAPMYPALLLSKGVSGYAFVRFVVDTLGVVDTISFRVVEATHPEFAVAVQRALPGMRFRPALQQGNRVPQWVEQRFQFRITRTDTARTH